jgi:hypothetical protein
MAAKAVHSKYSKLRQKLRLKDRVHSSGPQLEPVVHEEPPDGEGGRTEFMLLCRNKSQLRRGEKIQKQWM